MAANSKIGLITVTFCLVAVLLVSVFNATMFTDDYTKQAQKDFQQAYSALEQIRNVTIPRVGLVVVTRQWAIDTWGKGYAEPDLTNILREEKVYKALFMMREEESLYQANVDWAGYFGAATWGDKIYIVRENFDPFIQPDATATFVHELTHVMQGQFHMPQTPSTFDGDKARGALIEGDASFTGDYYKNQTKAETSLADITVDQVPWILLSNKMLNELHLDLPSTISYLNYFPYDYGKLLVNAIYQRGGWMSVNQAYANPPTTTEQVVHPDKYFANETAQQVAAPTLAEKDWTQVRNDRYGEYFIQVMLDNWLDESEAQTAAAGWSGDNFTYCERGGEFLFTWNIKWDSSGDASEFYAAFNNMLNAAGAEKENSNWYANGRYLSITWNQEQNSTLIAASTNETALLPSNFT